MGLGINALFISKKVNFFENHYYKLSEWRT